MNRRNFLQKFGIAGLFAGSGYTVINKIADQQKKLGYARFSKGTLIVTVMESDTGEIIYSDVLETPLQSIIKRKNDERY